MALKVLSITLLVLFVSSFCAFGSVCLIAVPLKAPVRNHAGMPTMNAGNADGVPAVMVRNVAEGPAIVSGNVAEDQAVKVVAGVPAVKTGHDGAVSLKPKDAGGVPSTEVGILIKWTNSVADNAFGAASVVVVGGVN